jgi:hypothetical protein
MALPAELMQNVPTIEEFWAAFTKSQEAAAKEREMAAKDREMAEREREEWNRRMEEERKKSAKKQAEWDRRMEERDRRMEEDGKKSAKRQEEWDRRIAEAKEEVERNRAEWLAAHKEAERTIDRVGKQMGDLNNRFGELAEHLVAPGIVRRFNELGYHFGDAMMGRLKILDKTGQNILTEIDLFLENGEYLIAVEVKSRPTLKDVAHQERRLEILREYKDRRQDPRRIRGAIAGAVFPEEVKKAVIEAGMYVIEQSGDTMRINIPEGFKPREW